VACSGEELAEGTVTRLAALKVLEKMRPGSTVTICLPLFLAGGEGDRAFARFYPTVAVDGCELRCAARATEMYSGKPAASVVVSEVAQRQAIGPIAGARHLNPAGQLAVDATAQQIAELVDDLLGKRWDRKAGQLAGDEAPAGAEEEVQATCSCGSGIPIQVLAIDGQAVTLVGLPLIFQNVYGDGKRATPQVIDDLMEIVRVYNPIPAESEESYAAAILTAFSDYCKKEAPLE
jgi:hypothetical protein